MAMKDNTKLLLKDSLLCLIVSSVIIAALSVVITQLSIFDPFSNAFKDFRFLDIYYSEEMGRGQKTNPNIILINIQHKDRYELAGLLSKLQQQKPKVIGIDVIFRDRRHPFADSLLARQLKKKNIIHSFAYLPDSVIGNHPTLVASNAEVGYSNINFDRENKVIRNFRSIKETSKTTEFSFTSQIVRQYDRELWKEIKPKLKKDLPIKYYGNYNHYLHYDYDEVVKMDSIPQFKDAILLLGYLGTPTGSTFDIEDKHYTPLNQKVVGKSPPDTYGITIHANILEMLLAKDFITPTGTGIKILIGLALTYFSLVYFIRLNKRKVARYMFTKKVAQFLFTIAFLYFSLYLLEAHILFEPAPIIAFVLLSVECIGIYRILINYLNKKYQWKSYYYV